MKTSVLKAFWLEEDGQDLVEYSLLLAFIAIAAITVLQGVGGSIKNIFTNVGNTLNSSATAAS